MNQPQVTSRAVLYCGYERVLLFIDIHASCLPRVSKEVKVMTKAWMIVPMTTEEEMDGKGYVHWKSWQETYAGLMPQEFVEAVTLEQAVSWAHSWPENTLVLKTDGRVIGFSCFGDSPDLDQAGEVFAIYLLADCQGQGLGLVLMEDTMEELAHKPQVILWVLKGNEKAIRFYQRYGFAFDGAERSKAYGTELRMIWKA